MVITSPFKSARYWFYPLLALGIIAQGWIWPPRLEARQDRLRSLRHVMRTQEMDCSTLEPAKIQLSALNSDAAIAESWLEDLLLNMEEDWEVFFTLTQIQVLTSADPPRSCLHQPLTLHLSCRCRKLYLQYQRFLC